MNVNKLNKMIKGATNGWFYAGIYGLASTVTVAVVLVYDHLRGVM